VRARALVAALGFAACGSLHTGATEPSAGGAVGGLVVAAGPGEPPLAGAAVEIVTPRGTVAVTSDQSGFFHAGGVAAGPLTVRVTLDGYLPVLLDAQLGGAAGSVPVAGATLTLGPIGLVRADGALTVQVVDDAGAPAPMVGAIARLPLTYVDYSSDGAPRAAGRSSLAASSGADGVLSFTALPDLAQLGYVVGLSDRLAVDVPPMQVTSAQVPYAFLGVTAFFALEHGSAATPTIVLAGPTSPLRVVDTNVDYLLAAAEGQPFLAGASQLVDPAGPLVIVFNQAIDPITLSAVLTDEEGQPSSVTLAPSTVGNQLTLAPSQALPGGARLNLALHVEASGASDSSRELDIIAPLFVARPRPWRSSRAASTRRRIR
jgi:hypothetical protein